MDESFTKKSFGTPDEKRECDKIPSHSHNLNRLVKATLLIINQKS